jgi:hypothetical protein
MAALPKLFADTVLLLTVSVLPPPLYMPLPKMPDLTLLPVTTLLLRVKLPESMMPPPFEVLLKPPVMVSPEITHRCVRRDGEDTRAVVSLTVKFEAPGPLIVRLVLMVSIPVVSVMVAGEVRLKLIASPDAALAIQPRSDPAPLSLVFVTVQTAPKTDIVRWRA